MRRIVLIFAAVLLLGCISFDRGQNITNNTSAQPPPPNITNATNATNQTPPPPPPKVYERFNASGFSFDYPINMAIQNTSGAHGGIFSGNHDENNQTFEIMVVTYVDTVYAYGKNKDDLYKLDPAPAPRTLSLAVAPPASVDVDNRLLVRVSLQGRVETLTRETRPFITVRTSPDGRRLAFLSKRDGDAATELYVLPVDGGEPERVTDIVITHLHFDHAGGIRMPDGSPAYPNAVIHLQAANLATARNPNPRERASYPPEIVEALEGRRVRLTEGSEEIVPGVWVHRSDGHTVGLQWVEVRDGDSAVAYPSDMIPYSHHLALPYTMGYDINAGKLLEEKAEFLARAVAGDWPIVFEHDPVVPAARVQRDAAGRYAAGLPLEL